MTNFDIDGYAYSLFSRVDEAKLLNHEKIDFGEWVAKPKMCHHNVSKLHLFNNSYIPIRGWLYFDLPGLNYVKFVAHSAIRTPDGEVVDITPSDSLRSYPFLDGNLSEKQYTYVVEELGFREVNYTVNIT